MCSVIAAALLGALGLASAPRALAEVAGDDAILHVTTTWTGEHPSHSESWSDPLTGASREIEYGPDGSPTRQFARRGFVRADGIWAEVHLMISYAQRAYYNVTWTYGPDRPEPREDVAAELREQQADGTLIVSGHEQVNGHDALVLSGRGHDTRRFWIDERSYEPLKMTVAVPGDGIYTAYYDTLPRTQANVAALWPRIPAGFEQVPVSELRLGGIEGCPPGYDCVRSHQPRLRCRSEAKRLAARGQGARSHRRGSRSRRTTERRSCARRTHRSIERRLRALEPGA